MVKYRISFRGGFNGFIIDWDSPWSSILIWVNRCLPTTRSPTHLGRFANPGYLAREDSETYGRVEDESFCWLRDLSWDQAPQGWPRDHPECQTCTIVLLGIIGMKGQRELPVDWSWPCFCKSTLDLQASLWVDGGFMMCLQNQNYPQRQYMWAPNVSQSHAVHSISVSII